MIDTNHGENPDHLARLLIRPGGGIKDSDRPKSWWMGVELSLSLFEAVVFPSDLVPDALTILSFSSMHLLRLANAQAEYPKNACIARECNTDQDPPGELGARRPRMSSQLRVRAS
jgi:hypothetical protein